MAASVAQPRQTDHLGPLHRNGFFVEHHRDQIGRDRRNGTLYKLECLGCAYDHQIGLSAFWNGAHPDRLPGTIRCQRHLDCPPREPRQRLHPVDRQFNPALRPYQDSMLRAVPRIIIRFQSRAIGTLQSHRASHWPSWNRFPNRIGLDPFNHAHVEKRERRGCPCSLKHNLLGVDPQQLGRNGSTIGLQDLDDRPSRPGIRRHRFVSMHAGDTQHEPHEKTADKNAGEHSCHERMRAMLHGAIPRCVRIHIPASRAPRAIHFQRPAA